MPSHNYGTKHSTDNVIHGQTENLKTCNRHANPNAHKQFSLISFLCFIAYTAFSIFAFAEYIVAVTNMSYYWTIAEDLPTEQIVVMRPGHLHSLSTAKQTSTNTEHQIKLMETNDSKLQLC